MDPVELRKLAVQVAGEAAGLLRDLSCTERMGEVVEGETIRADLVAEEYIIETLRSEGFRGPIITEERGLVEGPDGDVLALIDPLDGSKNYSNCIPWSSVSIAFAPTRNHRVAPGEVLAGAVAPIFYGEILSFDASDCYLGGRQVEASRRSPFIYVYIEHPEAARGVAKMVEALGGGYKIRSLGSAALEIAYVGIGRGTAFVDLRPKIRNVDVAAAVGLASKCGAESLTLQGDTITISTTGVERLGPIIVAGKDEARIIVDSISGPLSSAGH